MEQKSLNNGWMRSEQSREKNGKLGRETKQGIIVKVSEKETQSQAEDWK